MSPESQKKEGRSSTRDFVREVKSLNYATVKKVQVRGLTVVVTEMFSLGFEHIKVNAQTLTFYTGNVVWLLYMAFYLYS